MDLIEYRRLGERSRRWPLIPADYFYPFYICIFGKIEAEAARVEFSISTRTSICACGGSGRGHFRRSLVQPFHVGPRRHCARVFDQISKCLERCCCSLWQKRATNAFSNRSPKGQS